MNTSVLLIICAILFGSYDLAIKLTSGSGNPTARALIVQIFSVLTLALLTLFEPLAQSLIFTPNLLYAGIAGILMGFALNLLFSLLKNSGLQTSSILPFALIGRNLVLITFSFLILRDTLSLSRIIGLTLGLASLFLIIR